MFRITAAGLMVIVALGGCATLSESQCIASDWETIGYNDGAQGKANSQLLKHQNACVKHGIVPDRDAYLVGWNDGVINYCTPENGYAQGRRGAANGNFCPDTLRGAFGDAYQQGRTLYLAESEIRSLESAMASKEQTITRLESKITGAEGRLVNGELTPLERYQVLEETKILAIQQGELQAEIEDLIAQIAVKRERFNQMTGTLAYNY
jgi:hypothetical protein